jgi:hypothetical protein
VSRILVVQQLAATPSWCYELLLLLLLLFHCRTL